jgi:hypothetical protein
LLCELAPALPADRLFLSSDEYVKFYVVVLTLTIPRVLTCFHDCDLPLTDSDPNDRVFHF